MKKIVKKKVFKMNGFNIGDRFKIIILGIFFWWGICQTGIWSKYLLPSPQKVFFAFYELCSNGELFNAILVSFRRVVLGIVGAFVLAMYLGIYNKKNIRVKKWVRPCIHVIRFVPPLSIIPLLILWCGIGELVKVLLIFFSAFFPMFINFEKGFLGCESMLLEVGKTFSFSEKKIFREIILPYAIPDILTGIRVGMGYGWRAIVGAEMIAASSGLGYLILDAQYMARTDKVISVVFIIGGLGYLCDMLFAKIISYLTWSREN